MAFKRYVLRELHCPRCNAIAQLKVTEERENACLVYIVCNKCKLERYQGITTRKALEMMTKVENLQKRLDESTSEVQKKRLKDQISRLQEKIRIAGIGLGG